MTIIRVPRGAPRPSEAAQRAAIEHDRQRLSLAPEAHARDCVVAGPYAISIDGQELDEYVVWER